jgi:menaquinone-specific isochorismate synthase
MTRGLSADISTDLEGAVARLEEKVLGALDRTAPEPGRIIRLEEQIGEVDALAWLSAQSNTSKIYWRGRNQELEFAGVGVAREIVLRSSHDLSQLQEEVKSNTSKNIRFFGGTRFDARVPETGSDEWRAFGHGRFVVPRIELSRENDTHTIACHLTTEDYTDAGKQKVLDQLSELSFDTNVPVSSSPSILQRTDFPSQEQWDAIINSALELLGKSDLQKIVLARRIDLQHETVLDPWQLLGNLREKVINCYLFGFQPAEGKAFIGVSPERLYRRAGRSIESEAMAGTRPRGAGEADHRFEEELLHSAKDTREHQVVIDDIRRSLEQLCDTVRTERSISVRKLAAVQHLACAFEGNLKEKVTDSDILRTLHPTPAVCGCPVHEAGDEIARLEPFDRGWYAGPVGWASTEAADFAVGIRSGLIDENTLSLYAGAGIVEGSTPESEWREIEAKLDGTVRALTKK